MDVAITSPPPRTCNTQTTCVVTEGDTVTITCSLDPSGGIGQLSIVTPSGEISQASLTLFNIQTDEGGAYRCRAENDADVCTPAEESVLISVAGKLHLMINSIRVK